MSTLSLRKRLLLAGAAVLIVFLGLAGFALDRAFISSAEVSLKNQLKTQTFALLSVIEVGVNGKVYLPKQLPEARLMSPNSGLFAVILNAAGKTIWQSPSTLGAELTDLAVEPAGSETFFQNGESLNSPFNYRFSVSWETEDGVEHAFTLVLIEASNHFASFVNEHRSKIVLWLGLTGIFVLIMQMVATKWSLFPLVRVGEEIDSIERAKQSQIIGDYPEEIAQLTGRINLFIDNERNNSERYRNTLGDLAHSLKTPLAVVRSITDSSNLDKIDRAELSNYVDRMSNIVEYQLKRAATSRTMIINNLVDVEDVVKKVNGSLQKVHGDKAVSYNVDIDSNCQFYGDQSDFYELIGNLLDNAYKWCDRKVAVIARSIAPETGQLSGVRLLVEDDGPGVENNVRKFVTQRGVRADQKVDGQGIGLSISCEIVERYNGSMDIGESILGGARFEIKLLPTIAG